MGSTGERVSEYRRIVLAGTASVGGTSFESRGADLLRVVPSIRHPVLLLPAKPSRQMLSLYRPTTVMGRMLRLVMTADELIRILFAAAGREGAGGELLRSDVAQILGVAEEDVRWPPAALLLTRRPVLMTNVRGRGWIVVKVSTGDQQVESALREVRWLSTAGLRGESWRPPKLLGQGPALGHSAHVAILEAECTLPNPASVAPRRGDLRLLTELFATTLDEGGADGFSGVLEATIHDQREATLAAAAHSVLVRTPERGLVHCDLASCNMLVESSRRRMVLDWESAFSDGPPLYDYWSWLVQNTLLRRRTVSSQVLWRRCLQAVDSDVIRGLISVRANPHRTALESLFVYMVHSAISYRVQHGHSDEIRSATEMRLTIGEMLMAREPWLCAS